MLSVLLFVATANFACTLADVSTKTKDKEQDAGVISPFLIKRAREFFNHTNFFKNVTTDQEFTQVLTALFSWEAPELYQKNYPYYFAGHTYEHHPVWVLEIGKYDFRAIVERTPEDIAAAKKTILQGAFRALQSMEQGTDDESYQRLVGIVDYDGFSLANLAHPKVMTFILEIISEYQFMMDSAFEEIILINGNSVMETLVNSVRPAMGRIMEKVEIYGSNKTKWMVKLRKLMPPSSLPEWYGGSKGFKPVAVYG